MSVLIGPFPFPLHGSRKEDKKTNSIFASFFSAKIGFEIKPSTGRIYMSRLPIRSTSSIFGETPRGSRTGSLLFRLAKPTGPLPNRSSLKVDIVDRIVVSRPAWCRHTPPAGHDGLTKDYTISSPISNKKYQLFMGVGYSSEIKKNSNRQSR
jgi:hypothetical protein